MTVLDKRLSAVCLLCCAVGPVVVTALRIGDEDREVLQRALLSSRQKQKHEQKQNGGPLDPPPATCQKKQAENSAKSAQKEVDNCIVKYYEPHSGTVKDKCECIDDGIDETIQGFKDANCADGAKSGIRDLMMRRKMLGCPNKPICDEIKADKKHDKCMEKLHECMKKQGIDFDTSFLQKKGSLLELESKSNSTADDDADDAVHSSVGDDDDDDDDDDKEKDEVCKCAEAAMECVKMAALDNNCKEKKEAEYMDNMGPQKDNICKKKDKGDDGSEEEEDDEEKSEEKKKGS